MTEPIASKLARKIARNKARGQRTPEEKEDAVVKAYCEPHASYRSVAKECGVSVGTVMRIIKRRQQEATAKARKTLT